MSFDSTSERGWLLLFVLAALAGSTCLNKAVHVDDPYTLGVARRILEAPLDPMGGPAPWDDGPLYARNWNPPLWPALLALLSRVMGWSERGFHALAGVMYFFWALGLSRLLRRWTSDVSAWLTALVLAPAFLPGVNLMVDAPMAAFAVWSIEWALAAAEDDRGSSAFIAGILASMALLTKYTAIYLPALIVVISLVHRRPRVLAALIPIALLAGTTIALIGYRYGGLPERSFDVGFLPFFDRLRVVVRNSGGVVWLTPVWVLAAMARGRWMLGATIAILLAAVSWGCWDAILVEREFARGGYRITPAIMAHFAVFSGNGFVALVLAPLLAIGEAKSSRRPPRWVFLSWFLLGLVLNLFLVSKTPFGAVRHLGLFLLPLMILPMRMTSRTLDGWRGGRIVLWLNVIASALLGLGLALADADQANVYRAEAQARIAPIAKSKRVWVWGDPSFRYHAENAGARPWKPTDPNAFETLNEGGSLVIPLKQVRGADDPRITRGSVRESSEPITSANPLRTVNLLSNFYGASTMSLPWMIAPGDPLEQFLWFHFP